MEQLFWSIPLSLALSTISAILIGRFISLIAFAILLCVTTAICLAIIAREQLRRATGKWNVGWRPLGGTALALALFWAVLVILLLVDLERNHQLYFSLALYDHGMRVAWTESALRTGVPPINPLYMYLHPAPMRYYYFWYVLCAAVAQMTHLPARAVFNASCVWSGFSLAALIGLYLKHFLNTGTHVRRQFVCAASLLSVTGIGACVNIWNFFYFHIPLPGYVEVWPAGPIISWLDSLIFGPHHVASLVCCMFGFLLAWDSERSTFRADAYHVLFMASAFASAFGLSIYVAFAFFLAMLIWGIWQITREHRPKPVLLLATAGAGALVMLTPYLSGLDRASSNVKGGGSVFSFAVREMIPPDGLLSSNFFRRLNSTHPFLARNLANTILIAPGYAVELGFFLVILLIYLIPAWRGRAPLSPAQRSLVVISIATLTVVTFIRSSIIQSNDFGWRGALLIQFALLLLASEVVTGWNRTDAKHPKSTVTQDVPSRTPQLVRMVGSFALIFGVLTTSWQAIVVRFMIPVHEMSLRAQHDPRAGQIAHKAYISAIGYEKLDAVIAPDSVVQYNPWSPDAFWTVMDWADSAHQSAIAGDQGACGSEFGGDLNGCRPMAVAIDALYRGATGDQARSTCHQYGIQYLIARIYDPAWKDKDGWVWTLDPVVSDQEFRALRCNR